MTGVAFFDMDHTLIAANSGRIYARALRREGKLTLRQTAKVGAWLLRYKLGGGDMRRMLARVIQDLEGTSEQEVVERCAALYEEHIAPTIYREALERVEQHRRRGEPVVVLSASTPYIVRMLADHIGADDYLCTQPEVRDGVFTGAYAEPICFGAGKLTWAHRYCTKVQRRVEESTFYTDSYSDLPVLESVRRPIAVNPDPRLARQARKRGWTIERYRATVGRAQGPLTHLGSPP